MLSVLAEMPGPEDESIVTFSTELGDIFEDLRIGADIAATNRLAQNMGVCGQGMKLVGDFFIPESVRSSFAPEGGPGCTV